MEELKRISVFSKVIEAGSFSEAARQLNIAKSSVSTQVKKLEQELGVQLIHRYSRGLTLTEAGKAYFDHCLVILARAERAKSELKHHQDRPSGRLRIASPISFGVSQIVPVVAELNSSYPDLAIDLLFDDKRINLFEAGIDVAIRLGAMPDSKLIAKKMGEVPVKLYASPDYLKRHGAPNRPEDLVGHRWIELSLIKSPSKWKFTHKGNHKSHDVQLPNSALKTNSGDALVAMLIQGMGISASTSIHHQLSDAVANGSLESILNEYELAPMAIHAVYHHKDHIPAKVRVFVEYLTAKLRRNNWS